MGTRRNDLIGQKFGRLLVKEFAKKDKRSHCYWVCLCDCGEMAIIAGRKLIDGTTKSCGCLRVERMGKINLIHGYARKNNRSSEYVSWRSMISRCHDKNHENYKYYGEKGITVCERWKISFLDFLSDMGFKPSNEYTIDRFPNRNGNYEPGNCRWAMPQQQSENKDCSKLSLEIAEKIRHSSLSQKELAKFYDVQLSTINRIINNKRWVKL